MFEKDKTLVALSTVNGNRQWWRPFDSLPLLNAVLLQELIHNTGFSDTEIQQGLGLRISNDTTKINEKLDELCFR